MKKAEEENLDLVKIASNPTGAVCKLMDYGKYKFEQSKKEKEQRKNQKVVEIKEVQLSFNIQQHDIDIRVKSASKFISAGNKVKVSIFMIGRQRANPQLGVEIMNKFASTLEDIAFIEKPAEVNGRNIIMILAPNKKEQIKK